jgi:hypothetical protein
MLFLPVTEYDSRTLLSTMATGAEIWKTLITFLALAIQTLMESSFNQAKATSFCWRQTSDLDNAHNVAADKLTADLQN